MSGRHRRARQLALQPVLLWGEDPAELMDTLAHCRISDPEGEAAALAEGMGHIALRIPRERLGFMRAMMRAEAALLLMDADAQDIWERTPDQRRYDAWILVVRDCLRSHGSDLPIGEDYKLPA